MKKMLFSVLLSISTLTVYARLNGSLKFVPDNIAGIVNVDTAKGLNTAAMQDMRKQDEKFDKALADIEKELRKYGLKIKDMAENITVFISNGAESGAVVETKIPQSTLDKMVKDGFLKKIDKSFNIRREKVGSRVNYVVTAGQDSDLPGDIASKSFAFTYIANKYILAAEKKDLNKIISSLKKSNLNSNASFKEKLSKVNTEAMAWAFFEVPKDMPQQPMVQRIRNIDNVVLSVDVKGKDINVNGVLGCKSSQFAQQFSQQMQFMIMMFGGAAFKDDQSLAMDVTKSIIIKNSGKNINIKMNIPKSLQERLKKFAEKHTKNRVMDVSSPGPKKLQVLKK